MKEGGWWQRACEGRQVNRRGVGAVVAAADVTKSSKFHMAEISDMAKIICVPFQFQLFEKVP